MAQAVELHVVSDSTGETATRLVHALEAQFPEQPFEEIRHPMVESVDDLAQVVQRARGRPAVVVYTLVEPELRAEMRTLCRRARLHYCDLLGQPIEAVAKVSGQAARMRIAVERGRSVKDLKMGICGEHGGEPKSVAFCHELGLEYVSCSPYRVPLARLAAAQAALKESGIEAVSAGG